MVKNYNQLFETGKKKSEIILSGINKFKRGEQLISFVLFYGIREHRDSV